MRPRGRRRSQRRPPAESGRQQATRLKPGSPGQATLPERSDPAVRRTGGAPSSGLLPDDVVPDDALHDDALHDELLSETSLSDAALSGDALSGGAASGSAPSEAALAEDALDEDALDEDALPHDGLAETLSGAGLHAEGITAPADDLAGGDTSSESADLGALAADMDDADHTLGDAEGGGAPEVELSEVEVAEVLSGRIIPIGSFFGGDQRTRVVAAGAADDEAEQMAGARFLADASRLALAWTQERRLGLTSACGICLALAVCAAGWFSAGTRGDIVRGVAALWAGYLVLEAGRWLTAPVGSAPAGSAAAGSAPAGAAPAGSAAAGSAPVGPAAAGPAAAARTVRKSADLRPAGPAPWVAALGASAAECGVYAGLAVGAAAEHWAGMWTLAVAVVGLVAVRNLMSVCSTPPGFREQSDGAFRRISEAVLTMPVGGRILLIGIVAPIWGARVALLAMVEWAIISIGYGIAGRAAPGVTGPVALRGQQVQAAASSTLLRVRDDGVLARTLGGLVRGSLIPLPPAVLGLAAISGLALLGLHGLPGVLMIAPAIVMLLAAPGSGHAHTGRFDWLVPVLLLGSQLLYVAAIGVAARVPGPVTFILSAAILLRYTDLGYPGRPVLLARRRDPDAEPVERGTALGWEGRLLFVGLTAAMGLATVAYLALAAYLVLLIGTKVATSCLTPSERA